MVFLVMVLCVLGGLLVFSGLIALVLTGDTEQKAREIKKLKEDNAALTQSLDGMTKARDSAREGVHSLAERLRVLKRRLIHSVAIVENGEKEEELQSGN